MGAAVLPFRQPRAPLRWQIDEIAECYRVIDILGSVGMPVELHTDVSDEGDPWLVFVREDTQDVIIHITRIAGQIIAASAASDKLFRGRSLRDMLQSILQAQPFVLPANRPLGTDDRLLMHPATMLVAVVATAFLASQETAVLAGDGEAAFITPESIRETDPSTTARKQLLPLETASASRVSLLTDTQASYGTTIASAVMAAVAVIAGEQMLRPANLSRDESLLFSSADMANETKHLVAEFLASGAIGIEADLAWSDWQTGRFILASPESHALGGHLTTDSKSDFHESVPSQSETQIASTSSNSLLQANLKAASPQLGGQGGLDEFYEHASGTSGQLSPSPLKMGLSAPMVGAGWIGEIYSLSAFSGSGISTHSAISADPAFTSPKRMVTALEAGAGPQAAGLIGQAILHTSQGGGGGPIATVASTSVYAQSVFAQQAASLTNLPITPQASSAQPATSDTGLGSSTSLLTDFSAASNAAKSAVTKLSIADLFSHSAVIMRAMGIDLYGAGRIGSVSADVTSTASTFSKPSSSSASAILDTKPALDQLGQTTLSVLAKTSADSPLPSAITTSEASGLINKTTAETVGTIPATSTAIVSGTNPEFFQSNSLSTAAKLDSAIATKTPAPEPLATVQEPEMMRSAADIVDTVRFIVSFAYDPRHEIVLKGQDLEILQILVRANPLIAGADRVLLSHGQILAGDGVMLMPGVALVPAEVFAPKLVASLPTVQEGALEIFFWNDLTVTLAGVIDI